MGLISILDLQPIPIYDDDGIFENLVTEIWDYLKGLFYSLNQIIYS